MKSLFERLRTRRLASAFILLAALSAAIVGGLLLVGGNGLISLAEPQRRRLPEVLSRPVLARPCVGHRPRPAGVADGLADALQVSQSYIAMIERGSKSISMSLMLRYANVVESSVEIKPKHPSSLPEASAS